MLKLHDPEKPRVSQLVNPLREFNNSFRPPEIIATVFSDTIQHWVRGKYMSWMRTTYFWIIFYVFMNKCKISVTSGSGSAMRSAIATGAIIRVGQRNNDIKCLRTGKRIRAGWRFSPYDHFDFISYSRQG